MSVLAIIAILTLAAISFLIGAVVGFNRGINEADPAGWGDA